MIWGGVRLCLFRLGKGSTREFLRKMGCAARCRVEGGVKQI